MYNILFRGLLVLEELLKWPNSPCISEWGGQLPSIKAKGGAHVTPSFQKPSFILNAVKEWEWPWTVRQCASARNVLSLACMSCLVQTSRRFTTAGTPHHHCCQATEALIQFVSFVRQVNKSSCKVVGAIQDVSATSPGSFDAHPTAYEKDVGISSSFCLNSI